MNSKRAFLTLFAIAVLSLTAGFSCMEQEKEEPVPMDQTPPAVRDAIAKHLAGADVKGVEREMEHGKTVYEVEAIRNGQRVELELAEDGTVLEEEVGDDDEEDEDADGDD